MSTEREMARFIIEELRSMIADMFPKRCPCCGKVYRDLEDFLAETRPIPAGGSMLENLERDDFSIIDMNRNCTCGSTLMVVTSERRDMSRDGRAFRHRFGEAIKRMVRLGMAPESARNELLKLLRGEDPDLPADVLDIRDHLA